MLDRQSSAVGLAIGWAGSEPLSRRRECSHHAGLRGDGHAVAYFEVAGQTGCPARIT